MEENREWHAKWIGLDKDEASVTKKERAYLRRTFRVAKAANRTKAARLRRAASSINRCSSRGSLHACY
ncbi:hypothetical protein M3194_17535 [Paenibacillus glycanilyticus]|uniref:hypothetical protein n=1 Tax=Paenibacillus glycanilyticus TaxID=126569 RepID=UPI00203FB5DF|nr:hypothetical protein [Paenibacillus glycanilyticus]MCM3629148.1 hypothetical protein [Paenibacillus glycanilyticus]